MPPGNIRNITLKYRDFSKHAKLMMVPSFKSPDYNLTVRVNEDNVAYYYFMKN